MLTIVLLGPYYVRLVLTTLVQLRYIREFLLPVLLAPYIYTFNFTLCAASIVYMVDSHESDAFEPYFEKVHFLNIQNKQRLYITHSKARHLHLINSQHFFAFVNLNFFNSYFLKI